MSDCAHLDDAALYWLLGLTGLRSLGLAGCVRVTDIGLYLLGSKLTGLRQLNLSGCHEVQSVASYQSLVFPCWTGIGDITVGTLRRRKPGHSDGDTDGPVAAGDSFVRVARVWRGTLDLLQSLEALRVIAVL